MYVTPTPGNDERFLKKSDARAEAELEVRLGIDANVVVPSLPICGTYAAFTSRSTPPTFVRPSGMPSKRPIAASTTGRPSRLILARQHLRRLGLRGSRRRKLVDLRHVALERIGANADREMTETAKRTALPERRVAAGEREAELRRHELKDVDRLNARVVTRVRPRAPDTVTAARPRDTYSPARPARSPDNEAMPANTRYFFIDCSP